MKRTVIFFGASSGIGAATAEYFNKDGDKVYNLSRKENPNETISNRITDVVNPEEVRKAVDEIAAENDNNIDVMVYSAGFSMAAPIQYVKSADYRYLFDVNFFGFISAIEATLPHMKSGSRIVVVSSLGGIIPIAYDPFYSASKAAVNMLVKELQLELRKRKIYVTSLMPGGTKTDFTFKRLVYPQSEVGDYAVDLGNAVLSLQKTEQKGMSADSVGKLIFNVTLKEDPPILITAGLMNKIYYGIAKFVPQKCMYGICRIKYKV